MVTVCNGENSKTFTADERRSPGMERVAVTVAGPAKRRKFLCVTMISVILDLRLRRIHDVIPKLYNVTGLISTQ